MSANPRFQALEAGEPAGPFDFVRAALPPQAFDFHFYMGKTGCTKAEAKRLVRQMQNEIVLLSALYQANINPIDRIRDGWWVAFKRQDKEVIQDRQVYAEMVRALFGPGWTGLELFPADQRVVDTANSYHLWGIPCPGALEGEASGVCEAEFDGVKVSIERGWKLLGMPCLALCFDASAPSDWRWLQAAKNAIAGAAVEGAQIFDGTRQDRIRIFVLNRELRFPFGFEKGSRDDTAATKLGGKQRPFEAPAT